MSILIASNELICQFRPALDAIQLASRIRHSSDITSASSYFLQALIVQLKHVTLSSGSHFIFTGVVPAQSFTYKIHGLLTFILRHHNHTYHYSLVIFP
ncbi:hypothetical protein AHAS_Ahas16G0242000 [Arachis hypogaea]